MIEEEEEDSDLDVFEELKPDGAVSEETDWVPLPHTELLSIEDADEFLRWRAANVVAIVGERAAGKTTLVTELYERFLRGSFAGVYFAGSLTLAGFEKRCHHARMIAGASAPDTERTSARAGLRFFHLGMASEVGRDRSDLLITERAGESYRAIRNEPGHATSYLELIKARTVVFVIDGARVANDLLREETFSSVRHLIRGAADTGSISREAEVQLVTTKVDLLQSEELLYALEALVGFERRMTEAYSDRFAKITCWRTAARDPSGAATPAFGMDELLRSWLDPPAPSRTPISLPELQDEFDRFLLRTRNA